MDRGFTPLGEVDLAIVPSLIASILYFYHIFIKREVSKMIKWLKNLAISFAVRLEIAMWIAQTQAVALGFIIFSSFIDLLKEMQVIFWLKWAGWMKEDGHISVEKDVLPTISPPFEGSVRPP